MNTSSKPASTGPASEVPPPEPDLSQMPFVAPCRDLSPLAPLHWLRLGFNDFRRAFAQSVSYGTLVALASVLISWLSLKYGSVALLLSMLGGFVFLAPLVCIGLYVLSEQLERGERVSIVNAIRAATHRHFGNEMVFALVLMVIFLVWARAGAMVSVFFPVQANPELADLATYLGIGSAVGAVFVAVVFSASAFSLPMLVDRKVDTITAVVTSVNAVLRNKRTMLVWLGLIVFGVAIGLATLFLGLIVIVPVIGHAAWHGYHETIDATDFPRHAA
jgi:uncharacterized membrane protein